MDASTNGIEDILAHGVEDDEWLQVLHGQRPYIDLIDTAALHDYLEDLNREYCADNLLCPECRSPLAEKDQYEEYWGSRQRIATYLVCPRGC